MKRFPFVILLIMILGGIGVALRLIPTSEKKKLADKEQKRNELLSRELAKKGRQDTVFLGLRFGMTKEQTVEYLDTLEKRGKVQSWNRSKMAYKYDFSGASLKNNFLKGSKTIFTLDFYDNKLYKVFISVQPSDRSTVYLTWSNLFNTYKTKYGYTNYFFHENSRGKNEVMYVHKNRKIEIVNGISSANIIYTDLITEKKIKQQGQKKRRQRLNEIHSDI